MIEPLDGWTPPVLPADAALKRKRCSAALHHLRECWRLMEDAGVHEQFKERILKMALELKEAMGGKEMGDA